MSAELKAKITVDPSDLNAGLTAVRNFEGVLRDAFKRTPDLRAHEAIKDFVSYLGSGDVVGALTQFTSRFTGLGLVGGVAIGALGAGIAAAHKQLTDFDKSLDETGALLGKMPETGSGLAAVQKHLAELIATVEKSRGPGIAGTVLSILGDLGGGAETERRATRAAGEHNEKIDQIIRSLGQEADASQAVVTGQEEELRLAQKIAEIHEVQKERLAEVVKKHLDAVEAQKLYASINKAAQAEEQAARAEAGAAVQKKIREQTGLTTDELRAAGQTAPAEGFTRKFRQQFPVALQGDAYLLGISERLSAEGARLRGLGLRDAAGMYETQAQQIKSGLGSLRDSEKEPEHAFKSALDSASVFKEMNKKLDDISGKLPVEMTNR